MKMIPKDGVPLSLIAGHKRAFLIVINPLCGFYLTINFYLHNKVVYNHGSSFQTITNGSTKYVVLMNLCPLALSLVRKTPEGLF